VLTAMGGLAFGFLAGLLTFRLKNQWCPGCGATLACSDESCLARRDQR
jgi:hypothetical protein